MRACTLANNVFKNRSSMRVVVSLGGKIYDIGKVLVFDDELDDKGDIKKRGRILLCAEGPISSLTENETENGNKTVDSK